jgi:hypothetical protein
MRAEASTLHAIRSSSIQDEDDTFVVCIRRFVRLHGSMKFSMYKLKTPGFPSSLLPHGTSEEQIKQV